MTAQQKIFFHLHRFIVFFVKSITTQICNGSWTLQRPLTSQCVVGQWVGWQNVGTPVGCPTIPQYTGVQTNTFTFTYPVSSFSIDFRGFDGMILCARIEIKINGIFYPLTPSNLIDIPIGLGCSGSFSYVTLTTDGYITVSILGGSSLLGQGRIVISNVNATSVSVSTNDGSGTVFSDPFGCITIPLNLDFFSGTDTKNCKALLRWKSGNELNVKNIEIMRSVNGAIFKKVAEISPKGDNSYYSVETDNKEDAFFRLRINDLDDHYEYSEIIRVKSACNNANYQFMPNPVINIMEIMGLEKEDLVTVNNLLGQSVLRFNPPQNNNRFNLQELPSGIYIVQVFNDKKRKASLKVIKN